jgi:hypothetical protein
MSIFALQALSLKAATSGQPEAKEAWLHLIGNIGFDDLPDVTIRLLPRIYLNLRGTEGVSEFNRIRGAYKLNWVKNTQLISEAMPLFGALNNGGVEYCVFKGLAVAMTTQSIATRVFGDIDFVVHPRDIKRVQQLMSDNGWQLRDIETPLGMRGLGGYVNEHGLHLDLHSLEQFAYEIKPDFAQSENVAWRQATFPIASRSYLMRLAIHHGTTRAAESDLAQSIVDFLDLSKDPHGKLAESAVAALKSNLAGNDFLPLIAETGVLSNRTFQRLLNSSSNPSRNTHPFSPPSSGRKLAMVAPLIWRRRLNARQIWKLLRVTVRRPQSLIYALWLSVGQFRPVEKGVAKIGMRIARPRSLFVNGGPVAERDYRLVVPNPCAGDELVSITIRAERDGHEQGARERHLTIDGKAFGFFPVQGELEARYILESPGKHIEISLSSNHRLPVVQFASLSVAMKSIEIGRI